MRPLDHVIVRSDATVREALELLNKNAMGVLLMVDAAGKLLRTVTDGDLRRLLLAGSTMDGTIRSLPDKPPRSAPAGADDASALAIMNDFQVDHLPAVDGRGAPTGTPASGWPPSWPWARWALMSNWRVCLMG